MALNKSKWKRLWLFVLLLVVPASMVLSADISPDTIRATYLLNMTKVVTVGNPAHAPATVCYYERRGVPLNESVGQQIAKYVTTHPANNMPTVKKFGAIRDLSGCDIFYIPAEEESEIDNVLVALGASSTLTVSGAQRFILRGGMVGFVMDEDNRVKMEANLANARNKHVHIDVSLLEIMLRVIGQ